MEATLSLGLVSFGFLVLIPLLALGLKTSRQARDNRTISQIAQTVIEEEKQGTLPSGTIYLDLQGNPTSAGQALYVVRTSSPAAAGNTMLNRVTFQITPMDAPNRVQTYAVVLPTQ